MMKKFYEVMTMVMMIAVLVLAVTGFIFVTGARYEIEASDKWVNFACGLAFFAGSIISWMIMEHFENKLIDIILDEEEED